MCSSCVSRTATSTFTQPLNSWIVVSVVTVFMTLPSLSVIVECFTQWVEQLGVRRPSCFARTQSNCNSARRNAASVVAPSVPWDDVCVSEKVNRQRVNRRMLHGYGAARRRHGACGVHLSVAFVSCTRMWFNSGDTSHLLYGLQTVALSPEVLIHFRARSRDCNMT